MPSPMVALPWPITVTVIDNELKTMQEIVNRWQSRFSDEAFLQQMDHMGDVERSEVFGQFMNELKVCASKSATLVEVLA